MGSGFRRSSYVFVLFADQVDINLDAFFNGEVKESHHVKAVGISLLSGKVEAFDSDTLAMFAAINAQTWLSTEELHDRFGVEASSVEALAQHGFLLSNADDEEHTRLRAIDERLDSAHWSPYQAFSYIMSRWPDLGPDAGSGSYVMQVLQDYEELIEVYGVPPAHYHQVKSTKRVTLPRTSPQSSFFKNLLARGTAREFQLEKPLPRDDLATILFYTFGAQAECVVVDGYTVLKKTSPSAGALHPTEAYPLILNVEGMTPGIYHYNVRHHSLDLIRELDVIEGRKLANRLTNGQQYFASANFLVILTTRFDRNFWKYRNDTKALRVVEMDAAHLSQTFYLLGTELGLGTFTTAAIIDDVIDELLGLELLKEGAMLVLGCGYPADEAHPQGVDFADWVALESAP